MSVAGAVQGNPASLSVATLAVVVGVDSKSPSGKAPSAEVDRGGRPYLADQQWQKMDDIGGKKPGMIDQIVSSLYGNLAPEDRLRVAWLAGTLFFIIGG